MGTRAGLSVAIFLLAGCGGSAAVPDGGVDGAAPAEAGTDAGADAGTDAAADAGPRAPSFVRVVGRDLVLDGERWYSQGANWLGPALSSFCPREPTDAMPCNEAYCNMRYLDPEHWDPAQIERELRLLSEVLGVNTLRLHNPPTDAEGRFLPGQLENARELVRLALAHGIRIHWVLFFGIPAFECPQPDGTWATCNPSVRGTMDIGQARLMPPASEQEARMLATARTFVSAFRDDPGVLSWEVGNELMLNFTVYSASYQAQMLSYIKRIADEVRRNDPNHFLVSGEVASVRFLGDTQVPWVQGRGVEFVDFEDVHGLNGGEPFSLYDVVDVLGVHLYAGTPSGLDGTVAAYVASSDKPVLLGEYGYFGSPGVGLAETALQGEIHAAILAEARAHLSGAWVWAPTPYLHLTPGEYHFEVWPVPVMPGVPERPLVVYDDGSGRRVCALPMQHWVLAPTASEEPSLLELYPAALALADRRVGFVSQDVPTRMQPGQAREVSITLRNDGTSAWVSAGTTGAFSWRLKSTNPPDNTTFGLGAVGLARGGVRPGETVTTTFTITAPATPGTYDFQWRLNQAFVGWFGDPTPNVVVTVAP